MKEGIHPKYEQTTIRCACGAVIETGSTKKDITVEICSKCHPFYTGKQKLVDTSGRVDKFNKKYGIDYSFLYCFTVCRDARPGARRKGSPRQRARLHKRRPRFIRARAAQDRRSCRTRQSLLYFYIVFRFAAMPVPALAVKTRPGSGRGCTNGGFASSAPGGAKPPFLSDATGDYSFFIMFSGLPRGACGEHFK